MEPQATSIPFLREQPHPDAAQRRAWLVVGPVAATSLLATALFGLALFDARVGELGLLLVALFFPLFAWVAFWFWVTLIGVAKIRGARRELAGFGDDGCPSSLEEPLPLTAVVVPIHNESVDGVFARLRAMLESVAAMPGADRFEFFLLSDSSEPDVWLREEIAWAELRQQRTQAPILYYRRRGRKFRKKSGNIGEFCERWGRRYRYMIVLDADSVMDGKIMRELVRRMEHAPRVGILQAPSLPAMRHSFYARLQQFAASIYGPPIFAGLAYCFQSRGNFWGHNAILRMDTFIEHCGLPGLPGRPPLGGPILSHDFVEAALMCRGGYDVRLAWDLTAGSYEQCPVSLESAAARDRRWCQGNLQHARLILSPSFLPASRVHFAVGVCFYLVSVLWAVFTLVYTVVYVRSPGTAIPGGLREVSVGLFVTTFSLLFVAKLASLALAVTDSARARSHGGKFALVTSAVLETTVSVLVAPILMVAHVACVTSVLFGMTVDWGSVERGETPSPWMDAVRAYGAESLGGILLMALVFVGARGVFWWLSPIWVGLTFAVPLAAVLGSRSVGDECKREGLLLTPADTERSPILERVAELTREPPVEASDFLGRFRTFVSDPWFNSLHVGLLRAAGLRTRPRQVVAELVDRVRRAGASALSPDDALTILSDPWAMQTLHDESNAVPSEEAT